MDTNTKAGFTKRTLLALMARQAEQDAASADLRLMLGALAKEHGVKALDSDRV